MPNLPEERRAFTLIELLTVIAIIGILAAILIPVVGSVRDRANAAKCLSNHRQTGTAFLMYLNDNDYRSALARGGTAAGQHLWPRMLEEEGYTDAREIFFCPSIPFSNETDNPYDYGAWAWRVGIGLNLFDNDHGQVESMRGYTTLVMNYNLVETPSRYLLFGDSADGQRLQRFRILSRSDNSNGAIHLRHGNQANAFFLDGHVEAADPKRLGELGMLSGKGENFSTVEFPQPD